MGERGRAARARALHLGALDGRARAQPAEPPDVRRGRPEAPITFAQSSGSPYTSPRSGAQRRRVPGPCSREAHAASGAALKLRGAMDIATETEPEQATAPRSNGRLLIVIPAYNEAAHVGAVVRERSPRCSRLRTSSSSTTARPTGPRARPRRRARSRRAAGEPRLRRCAADRLQVRGPARLRHRRRRSTPTASTGASICKLLLRALRRAATSTS